MERNGFCSAPQAAHIWLPPALAFVKRELLQLARIQAARRWHPASARNLPRMRRKCLPRDMRRSLRWRMPRTCCSCHRGGSRPAGRVQRAAETGVHGWGEQLLNSKQSGGSSAANSQWVIHPPYRPSPCTIRTAPDSGRSKGNWHRHRLHGWVRRGTARCAEEGAISAA